jgi:hypothetical protein
VTLDVAGLRALEQRRPHAVGGIAPVRDILGDAILLRCAPWSRRLRQRATALGVRLVEAGAAELVEVAWPARADRVPFRANAAAWMTRARGADARWLPAVVPANIVVRECARAIARLVLARRPVGAGAAFALAEAFAETAQMLVRYFTDERPAHAIAYALNCPHVDGDARLMTRAPFRILELRLGTRAALGGVIACFATRHGARHATPRAMVPLLAAAGVDDPGERRASAPVLLALAELVRPTSVDGALLAARCAAAGVAPATIDLGRPATRDAVRALADTLAIGGTA